MEIIYIPISELKPNDKNPRKIGKDQFEKLCQNILNDPEYFAMRPCLVNVVDEEKIIYAGNQRYRAAKKIGLKEVPCIVENDVPEELLRKRIVLDNIHHGDHDYDMLSSLYGPYELIEWGMREHDLGLDKLGSDDNEETEEKQCEKCDSCGQKLKKKKK